MDKIGPIFGEFVSTEKIKRYRHSDDESSHGMRVYLVPLIFIASLILISLRLVFVQVVGGSYYRNLSETNRVKTIVTHAPRGIIFDRNKKPLVFNIPGFREIVNGETKLIPRDEAISLIAEGKKNLEIDSLRQYPHKDSMVHLLGYLGQVSEEELKTEEFAANAPGDLVGKMGIERQYESFLKGTDGKQLAEIDSMGKIIRKLGETDPIPGRNITLTIDADLQKKSYDSMKKVKKGAVIVSTPKGEILALISKPSFDPNLFTQGAEYKAASPSSYFSKEAILTDSQSQPFLNRAISGLYPPGSTFKLITAAAGLEGNIIDTSYTVNDIGVIKLGQFSFANWFFTNYGRTDGEVNVEKAIKRSNDIFFYRLAEKVGVEKLSDMARQFGIGKLLGIDLEGETKGLVPSNEWKKEVIGEQWYLGDTYHYGIGQGYLLSTPLEVNSWAQIIANNGTLYRPYILKDLGNKVINENFLSDKTIDPIKKGMIEACAPGGVAWPLFDFKVPAKGWSASGGKNKIDGKNFILEKASRSAEMIRIPIACKTGTAQHGGQNSLPHAWITLFAPAENPQIVVTVLSEESGEGSNEAAPIAKEILTEWFSR